MNGVKFGKGLKINGWVFIRNKGQIILGDNVKINSGLKYNPIGSSNIVSLVTSSKGKILIGNSVGFSNIHIYSSDQILIEDNVIIGGDTKIYDTDFHPLNPMERILTPDIGKTKSVKICKNSFIGSSCIVLKGSYVPKGSVIGAGSLLSKVLHNENSVYFGNPVVCYKQLT